jgi:hypothetical protein
MNPAIHFDYQFSGVAKEIGDEWPNGMLPSEFRICDSPVSHYLPQIDLCGSKFFAQ